MLTNYPGNHVEGPETNTRMTEHINIFESCRRVRLRHHDNRLVGKVTVSKRLLKCPAPVLDFSLKGKHVPTIQFLLERKSGELTGLRIVGPTNPHQIGDSETRQRKLPGRNAIDPNSSEIRTFEGTQEIRFRAFPGASVPDVLSRILPPTGKSDDTFSRGFHAEKGCHHPIRKSSIISTWPRVLKIPQQPP